MLMDSGPRPRRDCASARPDFQHRAARCGSRACQADGWLAARRCGPAATRTVPTRRASPPHRESGEESAARLLCSSRVALAFRLVRARLQATLLHPQPRQPFIERLNAGLDFFVLWHLEPPLICALCSSDARRWCVMLSTLTTTRPRAWHNACRTARAGQRRTLAFLRNARACAFGRRSPPHGIV